MQGAASDLGPSFAFATVNEQPQTFQDTYTNLAADGSQWSIVGAVTSTTDNVDHTQDVFFLWLNPQAVVSQTGAYSGTFTIGTPNQQNGQPQPMDIIDVSVAELLNPSLIPASKLGPQTVNGVSGLPGLSTLCAQPTQCTANDFANIVQLDSLLTVVSTETPSAVDKVRFVYIGNAQLQGPECSFCDQVVTAYWYTDSGLSSNNTETFSYTVALRASTQTSGSFTLPLAESDSFTWSNLTSLGSATGLHQSQAILESSVLDCYENLAIFEDTLFHTFLFQQPTGNTGC